MISVMKKTFTPALFCDREILRYAGCKAVDENILTLLETCKAEAETALCYNVCYAETQVSVSDGVCDFGFASVRSQNLAKNLENCSSVVFFAATIGLNFDRLIKKYSHLSPSKAVMLDAIGVERVEALCDAFCEHLKNEHKGAELMPRFSAGYGDLPLEFQKEIFAILSPGTQIGVTLNDSLLMSPSKSVTAIVGIKEVN